MPRGLEAIYLCNRVVPESIEPVELATGEGISKASSMRGYATTLMGSLRCEEHRRLLDNFAGVVKELLALHQQHLAAAISGDPDCTRFDPLIEMANQKKQAAKYAYLRHVKERGCNRFDLVISHDRSGSAPTAEPKRAEAQGGLIHRQP